MIRSFLILSLLLPVLRAASLDDLTWEIVDGEATIVDCKEEATGDLVIPLSIEGNPVTAIKESAFLGCSGLEKITIPDSVTRVGASAFGSCVNLIEVSLPDGLTEIEFGLFAHCWRLRTVVIPEGVTKIGGWAFAQCQSLIHVTIPDRVISIGEYAFEYCPADLATVYGPGLQSVVLGQGLVSIGDFAFYEVTSLNEITIPESTTSIGYLALVVWGGKLIFDGAAPEVPDFDPMFWFPPMAQTIHVWPQHLSSFDDEHYLWSQSKIVVRDTSPTISSLSHGGESVTIRMTGAPNTSYVCKTSGDLETFKVVTTDPPVLSLDSRGKMAFTVKAEDASRFFVIEELP